MISRNEICMNLFVGAKFRLVDADFDNIFSADLHFVFPIKTGQIVIRFYFLWFFCWFLLSRPPRWFVQGVIPDSRLFSQPQNTGHLGWAKHTIEVPSWMPRLQIKYDNITSKVHLQWTKCGEVPSRWPFSGQNTGRAFCSALSVGKSALQYHIRCSWC